MEELVIPGSVQTIGRQAFLGCTGLSCLVIPQGVQSIEGVAFYGCENLSEIEVADSVNYVGAGAFDYTSWFDNQSDELIYIGKVLYRFVGDWSPDTPIVLRNDTTGIAGIAFAGKSFKTFDIPNSVVCIGEDAFSGCINLKEINIPDSVERLEYRVFSSCTSLEKVSVGNSVKQLNETFHGCSALKEIEVGESVESIIDGAFMHCTALKQIVLPERLKKVSTSSFYGCTELETISIPAGVSEIGQYAFVICNHLSKITILNPSCAIYDESSTISDSATIFGYRNSTAESYARKFNRTFIALDEEPTTEPTTQPDGDSNDQPQKLNFFQRIIQWFRNLFARLFGKR